jgi:hypothetical protein
MPVWRTRPVSDEPTIELESWRIFETADGLRFFCGYNRKAWEGRGSNVILSYDPETRVGRSRTGRIYKLIGEPRFNRDAQAVLEAWCSIHRIDVDTLVFVEPTKWPLAE